MMGVGDRVPNSENEPAPLLDVRNLRVWFDTREGTAKAVDDVSFTLHKGKILGLVGESGSGKSMTGFSIMGLLDSPGRIAGGQVLFQGKDLVRMKAENLRKIRGKRIAMIFQDPMMTLNPVLRIDTQMIEAILAHENVPRHVARARARDALAMVGIPSPEERLSAYPHQFSGGMRQRVAIATALLHRPDLIIADEPTTALDVTIQAQIIAEVQKLVRDLGMALIWITHDLSVVARLADEVAVMYAGQIVEHGGVSDIVNHPKHPYTAGLLDSVPSRSAPGRPLHQIDGVAPSALNLPSGCAFRSRCRHADASCWSMPPPSVAGDHMYRCFHPLSEEPSDPAQTVEARIFADVAASGSQNNQAPVIELCGVSRRFSRSFGLIERGLAKIGLGQKNLVVQAVKNVDLIVEKRTVVGLVGESGCGKSTLGRIATGVLHASDGEVRWNGRNIDTLPIVQRRAEKLRTQMIYQNPFASLNPRLRVAEIIAEAPRVHSLIEGSENDYVDAQLQRAGLDPLLKWRYPHQLSGGQRQRVGIARALAVRPEILVCDESVAALDVSIQAQIINLFMRLRGDLGLTYLFISHDLGVVRHISDRVAVMYLGQIVEEAPAAEIFSQPNHPYTQLLLEEMPRIDTRRRTFPLLKGELPSPLAPPGGCSFHPRCPHAFHRCKIEEPQIRQVAPGHRSACHLNDAV
jgi:peptide/nickel transport system ATP-binding protein